MNMPGKMLGWLAAILSAVLLSACVGKTLSVEPVSNFNADRYLGTWFEIARLDHPFERGLSNVTATYSKRSDGLIEVVNRGYHHEKGGFQEAKGRAKFAGEPSKGSLRVSFFGPFFGDYIIFGLDTNYRHAFVSGGSDNYLWLLSRQPTISSAVKRRFLERADALGYDTADLIWVDQSRAR